MGTEAGSARRRRAVPLLDVWRIIVDKHVESDCSADDREDRENNGQHQTVN